MKTVCIHAGHNPKGKIACGASGYLDESTEARYITKKIIKYLKKQKIKVKDCTVNNGVNQSDVLKKICAKSNSVDAGLTVSIHFNAATHESKSNDQTLGTEVWVNNRYGIKGDLAEDICKTISKFGFKNRGVKTTSGLYFLNRTTAPAVLVEVCFVTDKDDAKLYKAHRDDIAEAIAKAIIRHI